MTAAIETMSAISDHLLARVWNRNEPIPTEAARMARTHSCLSAHPAHRWRRKGGAQEKEQARWASKGLDIAKIADAAPTQEEADHAGKDFFPSLALRMRVRLQGFPDWWQFTGGKISAARQFGNAVPPVVGQAIGLAVSALEGETLDYEGLLPR
jgi:site-specific DNA-cytosine methylase